MHNIEGSTSYNLGGLKQPVLIDIHFGKWVSLEITFYLMVKEVTSRNPVQESQVARRTQGVTKNTRKGGMSEKVAGKPI